MSLWGKIRAKITGKESDVPPKKPTTLPGLNPGAAQAMYNNFVIHMANLSWDDDAGSIPEGEQAEPIVGLRGWELATEDGQVRLRSVTAGDIWQGPILRAEHEPRDYIWFPGGHPRNRDLGIFAYSPVEGAYRTATEHAWPVIGLVELFGKVVVHERGYRAAACRIRELWIEPDTATHRDALAELYQCEVHVQALPTDAPLHVDDLPDPNECPMCGHEHPDEPLNCKENKHHGDRQPKGDRESEGAIRPVPWEGGRSRIPTRQEARHTAHFTFGGPVSTGALRSSITAHLTP